MLSKWTNFLVIGDKADEKGDDPTVTAKISEAESNKVNVIRE